MEIPKIKLVAEPETKEARDVVGYKWNDVAGTRHFLGGKPDGLKEEEFPTCDDCKKTMTFYAKVDSIGDKFDLGDCMVIHNFVCLDCFTVKAKLTPTVA